MSSWLVTNLVATAFLPPTVLILGLVAGLLLLRRHRHSAVFLLILSTVALYILSMPLTGRGLLTTLQPPSPVTAEQLTDVDAIVVLGGGRRRDAAEYGGRDTLSRLSFERLRYGVHQYRASHKPLLVTGGMPGGGTSSEGELMRDSLVTEYGITPRWVETASNTTWDNARLSAALLSSAHVRRIALVTHAWHLRRAVPLFEAQGLAVVPAGVNFSDTIIRSPFDLLPAAGGLRDSYFALHEWIGVLWYKLRSLSEKAPA